jgi:hypothetical protein
MFQGKGLGTNPEVECNSPNQIGRGNYTGPGYWDAKIEELERRQGVEQDRLPLTCWRAPGEGVRLGQGPPSPPPPSPAMGGGGAGHL